MTSHGKKKSNSKSEDIRNPATDATQEQVLNLQQLCGQRGIGYISPCSTGPDNIVSQSEATVSDISPSRHLALDLEGDKKIAFYPQGANPFEGHRSALADAVIEHLRQARLRRQLPH